MNHLLKAVAFVAGLALLGYAGPIPAVTGIIATDCNSKTWDFDALLKAGKHIVVHQAFSG